MLYGTDKQIKWANDILARSRKYKARLLLIDIKDKALLELSNKALTRIKYIEEEQSASSIINWYAYAGIENHHGRRVETFRKFLIDILDIEDVSNINRLIELERRSIA